MASEREKLDKLLISSEKKNNQCDIMSFKWLKIMSKTCWVLIWQGHHAKYFWGIIGFVLTARQYYWSHFAEQETET